MTSPQGTFESYLAVGNREDLSDMIHNISPTETPFMSMAKRGKATHRKFEWQTDSLRAAATNTQIEGDDPSNTTVAATTRMFNTTQISNYAFVISGTQRAENPAGRADELAYQLVKYGKELKRDMEKSLTGNQSYTVGTSGAARVTASLESWISTNWTSLATSRDSAVSAGFSTTGTLAPDDGSVEATVTEAAVKAVIRACWTQGGNPDVIMCGPYNKVKISGFSGIGTQSIDQPARKGSQAIIVAAADTYVSDFGTLKVVPNRFSRDRTVTILDMEYWEVTYLRPFQSFPLAKTGDSDRRMILAEYGLVSRNEAASGKVADLATS